MHMKAQDNLLDSVWRRDPLAAATLLAPARQVTYQKEFRDLARLLLVVPSSAFSKSFQARNTQLHRPAALARTVPLIRDSFGHIGRDTVRRRAILASEEANVEVGDDRSERGQEAVENLADVYEEAVEAKIQDLKMRAERFALEAEKLAQEARFLESRRARTIKFGTTVTAGSFADVRQAPARPWENASRAIWPGSSGTYHRVANSTIAAGLKTRPLFYGTRVRGTYEGSFLVDYTLPGEDNVSKALDLLPTSEGTPSFGAVRINLNKWWRRRVFCNSLPLESNQSSKHAVVQGFETFEDETKFWESVIEQTTSDVERQKMMKSDLENQIANDFEIGGVMKGDIIRAIGSATLRRWDPFANLPVPGWLRMYSDGLADTLENSLGLTDAIDGLIILDGKSTEAVSVIINIVDATLLNKPVAQQEVVMIIERPCYPETNSTSPDNSTNGSTNGSHDEQNKINRPSSILR